MTQAFAAPAQRQADASPDAFSARNGVAYGLLGLPLAFVALPLYVVLPKHYATTLGEIKFAFYEK